MAKLDWGKASQREADPARAQRVHDFVEPDRVIVSVTNLTRAERKKIAAEQARLREKARMRKSKAAAARKAPPAKKSTKEIATLLSEEEKRLGSEAKRAAKVAHQQRYLAKAQRQLAEMSSKLRTHLQAWADKQAGLRDDRVALRQGWRDRLLRDRKVK